MNILLVDDDLLSLRSLEKALLMHDFQVQAFSGLTTAMAALAVDPFDIIITDYHLPNQKGTAILHHLNENKKEIPVIVISGDSASDIETLSIQAGARAFFRKPLDIEEIIVCMEREIKK